LNSSGSGGRKLQRVLRRERTEVKPGSSPYEKHYLKAFMKNRRAECRAFGTGNTLV